MAGIDAKTNETVSKLAVLSRFFLQNCSALETPRNASIFFRNFAGFCVLRLFVSRKASNFTNWILRLFEIFEISFGGAWRGGFGSIVVLAFHVLTQGFTPKGRFLCDFLRNLWQALQFAICDLKTRRFAMRFFGTLSPNAAFAHFSRHDMTPCSLHLMFVFVVQHEHPSDPPVLKIHSLRQQRNAAESAQKCLFLRGPNWGLFLS